MAEALVKSSMILIASRVTNVMFCCALPLVFSVTAVVTLRPILTCSRPILVSPVEQHIHVHVCRQRQKHIRRVTAAQAPSTGSKTNQPGSLLSVKQHRGR